MPAIMAIIIETRIIFAFIFPIILITPFVVINSMIARKLENYSFGFDSLLFICTIFALMHSSASSGDPAHDTAFSIGHM